MQHTKAHKNQLKDSKLRNNHIKALRDSFPEKKFMLSSSCGVEKKSSKRKIESSPAQKHINQMWKLDKYNLARVYQSIWLIDQALPSTVVKNKFYQKFVQTLNGSFLSLSRQTEMREEFLIYSLWFRGRV